MFYIYCLGLLFSCFRLSVFAYNILFYESHIDLELGNIVLELFMAGLFTVLIIVIDLFTGELKYRINGIY